MPLGHVLIIRPGALGDAVLTLPTLSALRHAGAESITILGTPGSWAFLDPATRPVTIADFSSIRWTGLFADGAALSNDAIQTLRSIQTVVVYLNGETPALQHRLMRNGVSNVLVIEPPVATPYVSPTQIARCFDFDWQTISEHHAARQLLDPLVHCVSDPQNILDSINPFRGDDEWMISRQEKLGDDATFAVHPGSGGRRKWWSVRHFADLTARVAREFKLRPVVVFGPADEGLREQFTEAMPSHVEWEAVENQPLREVLTRLQSCRCFVGNDSGLSHAAARIVPVLSIFGPTDPGVWGAIGRRVRIVEAPRGDLTALDVETVLKAFAPLLHEPGKRLNS